MNRILRFGIIVIILFSAAPFFPEDGGSTASLEQIDTLIKDTNYDEALEQLHSYITAYPERFDEAQKRIKKVLDARNRYTMLANTLIDVIQNDPGNDEKILAITKQLEELEKHPTEKQLAFIREAKVAAQFNYYRAKFTEIMKSGAEQTRAGNYGDSVDTVRSGFYMYQDDFFEQYTAADVVAPVRASLEQIDKDIALYKALQLRMNDAVNAFIRAVRARDAVQAESAFKNVNAVYAEYAGIRNSMCSAGWRLQSVFAAMKLTNPDLTDASFLPFVLRFLFGIGSVPDAGIVVSMDYEWNMLTKRMKTELYAAMNALSDSFCASASGNIFESQTVPSGVPLEVLIRFSKLEKSTGELYGLLSDEKGAALTDPYPEFTVSSGYAAGVSDCILAVLDNTGSLLQIKKKASSLAAPASPGDAEMQGSTYVSDLLSAASSLEKITAVHADAALSGSDWAVPYNRMKSENQQMPVWELLESTYRRMDADTASFVHTTATALWTLAAEDYAACGTVYVGERNEDLAVLQKRYKGSTNPATGLTAKYPQEALNGVTDVRKKIADDKNVLVPARNKLGGGNYAGAYASSLQSVSDSIAALDAISPVVDTIETGAKEQVRLAKLAQNEADLRLSQARAALESNDFDTARKRLQNARTKYNEALAYQESPALRAETDSELADLGSEISKKQNEVVVRQVRALKTRARSEYYNGNFDTAENLLTQAKTLWALTNVEDDEEITNLLALVSTALSMKTGRVIPPTAPLYPEMSQILSIAQQYFKQGSDLLNKNKHDEGVAVLKQALQKLQELQLVYPLNQDASLLTLRIQKILDPDGFTGLFAKRVETARQSYKIAGKQQSSYTDLLDLYAINPSYPGLKQLIYDVEIDLGIRQKPVDRTALNKSKSLTADAQRMADAAGRDEVKLQAALAKVNEALQLDPDNDGAMLLKDRIQTSVGGKAAVVLSSEDEAKYQQAISELQNNNIVTANSLVEQLLQKASNKRSSKILDLQKKIKAML